MKRAVCGRSVAPLRTMSRRLTSRRHLAADSTARLSQDVVMDIAPDRQRLSVQGETFEVVYDAEQPGTYHFAWLSGPNPGYGFSSRTSTHTRVAQQDLIDDAINFLAQVDPQTGYIED